MTSLCAVHPEREATGTCERCGVFGCAECLALLGERRLCTACQARERAGLPSLSERARWAGLLIWAAGLGELALSLLNFLIPDAEQLEGAAQLALGLVFIGAAGLFMFVLIAAIVMFCRWFHLLVRHAMARGISVGATPAGAVGSFFIPFVNLVKPFALAKQIAPSAGVVIERWQALWIVSNIVSNVGSRLEGPNAAAGSVIGFIGSVLSVGAAYACNRVITELTASTEASR